MVGFPLLLIPIAIYNIVVWLMPGVSPTEPLVKLTLVSGTVWSINLSTMLLALGVLMLLLEIVKGARPGSKYLTDHLLSLIVFGAAAAEFVMWEKFGNSTFFLLALMAMVDFFGGIALHARRRVVPAPVPRQSDRTFEAAPVVDPRAEPVPPPPVVSTPPAASVAESVLLDHPQPKPSPAAVTSEPSPDTRSPTIPSPELQPGAASVSSPETPRR